MKYRADIDGLRSVAVIPVILFHLGFSWIDGGYYGVDVFFVISGFLITTILFNKIIVGSFSMKDFWLRRVNRILPAIITVIIATLLVAYFFAFKGDINLIATDALSALFSYGNFHMWLSFGDYWGASAENSFFLHSWSLSLEEQFYIFYPLFLLLLFKKKQSISRWLIAIIVISLIVFLYGSKYHPTATFYLLPTRAWELACGGLLSMAIYNNFFSFVHNRVRSLLATLGLILILSSYFVFTGREIGYKFSAILPVLGTVLIIAFSSSANFTGKLLSFKPIVYIGKISYSLYLWHWPIIVFLKSYYSSKLLHSDIVVISFVTTTLLSILSYYFVENKTRKWRYTPKLVLFLVIIVLGMAFFLKSSFVSKVYEIPFNKTTSYGYYYNIHPVVYKDLKSKEKNEFHPRRQGTFSPNPDENNKDAYKNKGIITSSIKGNPEIMVIGDSHGTMWSKTIDEIAEGIEKKASFYTANGASPFFNVKNIENQQRVRVFNKDQRVLYAKSIVSNIKTWKPKLLIIVCRWDSLSGDVFRKMESLVELSKSLGGKVLILNQPPQINTMGDRNSSQFLTFLGYKPKKGLQYIKHDSNIDKTNRELVKRFSRYFNVSFFDTYSYLIQEGNQSYSMIVKDSDILYYDDDHLSYQGTTFLKKELNKVIIELISEKNM
jgi:peptidoglycan/LPS O-acetylase OafA/YrhL